MIRRPRDPAVLGRRMIGPAAGGDRGRGGPVGDQDHDVAGPVAVRRRPQFARRNSGSSALACRHSLSSPRPSSGRRRRPAGAERRRRAGLERSHCRVLPSAGGRLRRCRHARLCPNGPFVRPLRAGGRIASGRARAMTSNAARAPPARSGRQCRHDHAPRRLPRRAAST